MAFGVLFRSLFLTTPVLLSLVAAQGGCRGDTSIYNLNGLVVPFKNLCGKDIQKVVDFLDPTDERTWSDCLDRCVMKAPLCYGFDFTPYGMTDYSCWLMNATFSESDATTQTYTVDAAMLSSEFLNSLSSDCKTLGLQGCFQKNGQLGTSTRAVQTTAAAGQTSTQPNLVTLATIVTTAVTINAGGEVSTVVLTMITVVSTAAAATTAPASDSNGISTGAKAGIGAGAGAIALIAILIAVVCVLKRRKRKKNNDNPPTYVGENEKIIDKDPHRRGMAELQAHQYGPYGSPELVGSTPPEKTYAFAAQEQIHKIDGSNRYEK